MDITIREAGSQDVDQISLLLMDLFGQESEFKPDFQKQRRAVSRIINHPEIGRMFVMEGKDRTIGVLSMLFTISTALGGKVAILEDFIIHREFRDMGLGKRLLNEVIKRVKQYGCLRINLLTDDDNSKAQHLYQEFGFRITRMKSLSLVFDGNGKTAEAS